MERGEQGGKQRHYQAPPLPPVFAVVDLSGLGVHGPESTPLLHCRRSIRGWLCMHDVFISLALSSFLICSSPSLTWLEKENQGFGGLG